jgi:acyl carrier protein
VLGEQALVGPPTSKLEKAIIRRLGQLHHEGELDESSVDCRASFFAPTGFSLGDRVLDSLDIVEIIVTLEVDFGVDLVEAHDIATFDSISKLCVLLEQITQPAARAEFERLWCT